MTLLVLFEPHPQPWSSVDQKYILRFVKILYDLGKKSSLSDT